MCLNARWSALLSCDGKTGQLGRHSGRQDARTENMIFLKYTFIKVRFITPYECHSQDVVVFVTKALFLAILARRKSQKICCTQCARSSEARKALTVIWLHLSEKQSHRNTIRSHTFVEGWEKNARTATQLRPPCCVAQVKTTCPFTIFLLLFILPLP